MVVDLSLAKLEEIITGIAVYDSGYAGLITDLGLVVAHKSKDLEGKNLFDINRFNDPTAAAKAFKAGKAYTEEVNTKEGRVSVIISPLPSGAAASTGTWPSSRPWTRCWPRPIPSAG